MPCADNRQICFNYYEWDFSKRVESQSGTEHVVPGEPVEDDLEERKLLSDLGLDERSGSREALSRGQDHACRGN